MNLMLTLQVTESDVKNINAIVANKTAFEKEFHDRFQGGSLPILEQKQTALFNPGKELVYTIQDEN
ncbi:hypothetical protein ABTF50_19580, partial [Acinetobacter baumannii]